ncbi:cytochrome C oxidase subunit IV family protein [Ensifer adhaerens]|uniref:cytochrome C oxidase subunit IV family protein n=1 Tax=Ensifer adhaerens TaxID=106592 RepID=UPI001CBA938A|nr:cytochrome C oxidase subunit IV family protein [Ensifer adhaerens]MBZ7926977.1 cytochrome C oxidase subunit IV family protein [Ensifer adhaerens]UAX96716.1 cytochrome C oxidase subunit IV family protein [Ensifer adhaerens]UAY03940.1 cytochrome C oxidase subunit IV family protein [Ensifer adhaerens]UAY11926.1 cytochrome C oxidase subunit IV family protein [Ensifer adhaerens]
MTDRNPRQLINTWLLLAGAVISGMALMAIAGPATLVIAVLLGLAIVKCRFVALDFMGLRQAPSTLRLGLLIWPAALVLIAAAKLVLSTALFS